MGTRSSRLQEAAAGSALGKDAKRPTSLTVDFTASNTEPGPSGTPDRRTGVTELSGSSSSASTGAGVGTRIDEAVGRGNAHRSFPERHSVRPARSRGAHPRPVSEAWIGLYRVNNRHGSVRCPFCTKPFPGGRIEDHLLSCLTSPPLPYNTDILTKDAGECSICLEELLQGESIARLACLCVYHKSCIDSWCKVKACCPEHPFD